MKKFVILTIFTTVLTSTAHPALATEKAAQPNCAEENLQNLNNQELEQCLALLDAQTNKLKGDIAQAEPARADAAKKAAEADKKAAEKAAEADKKAADAYAKLKAQTEVVREASAKY